MEILKFACKSCNAQLQAAATASGEAFICPHCEQSMRVPKPSDVGVIRSGAKDKDPTESVVCPVCNTRVTIQSRDLGKRVMCPDCQTAFVAKLAAKKAPVKQVEMSDDDIYSLKEAVHDDTSSKQMAARYFAEAERQSRAEKERPHLSDKPYQKMVEERAAAQFNADMPPETKRESLTPEDYDPRSTRVQYPLSLSAEAITTDVKFFLDIQFLTRWIVIAMATAVVFYMAINAVALGSGAADFGAYFNSFALTTMTVVVGAIVLVFLASAFMNISTSIASGVSQLEWPETPIFERIMETIFFVVALILAMTPAGLVAALVSPWLAAPLGILGFFLFPYFYLALLDSGSPIVPFSGAILAAVGRKLHKWFLFYIVTGVVLLGILVLGALGYYFSGEQYKYAKYMVLPAGVLTTGFLLFYAVWLGKLGWECSQDAGETPEKPRND
ncbi:hypothetical protein M4951_08005 [Blastopirellula sp. J2-11]|uniref:hypothetical protein n=1 Tax=Blastopirellula sp. J2-11 TaxID=2943192 RepID=UPI0021C7A791|nr:hypothetical protein [Blastopirellula sp. J2-11]UUO08253.1 hypothetical protein M4951_08005 [Blastopirellula sp. J2-11]